MNKYHNLNAVNISRYPCKCSRLWNTLRKNLWRVAKLHCYNEVYRSSEMKFHRMFIFLPREKLSFLYHFTPNCIPRLKGKVEKYVSVIDWWVILEKNYFFITHLLTTYYYDDTITTYINGFFQQFTLFLTFNFYKMLNWKRMNPPQRYKFTLHQEDKNFWFRF